MALLVLCYIRLIYGPAELVPKTPPWRKHVSLVAVVHLRVHLPHAPCLLSLWPFDKWLYLAYLCPLSSSTVNSQFFYVAILFKIKSGNRLTAKNWHTNLTGPPKNELFNLPSRASIPPFHLLLTSTPTMVHRRGSNDLSNSPTTRPIFAKLENRTRTKPTLTRDTILGPLNSVALYGLVQMVPFK